MRWPSCRPIASRRNTGLKAEPFNTGWGLKQFHKDEVTRFLLLTNLFSLHRYLVIPVQVMEREGERVKLSRVYLIGIARQVPKTLLR